jgi:hypothetical protein
MIQAQARTLLLARTTILSQKAPADIWRFL